MIFRFEDVEVDLERFELRRGGTHVHLEPQVFDVLVYLLQHRDRVVTKEELLDNVWGDRFVSESALTSRLKAARKAVGDSGKTQRLITTVHGRGYRFVAAVQADASAGVEVTQAPAPALMPRRLDRFIGREHDLERLAGALADSRLVTLVGAAGVGKTRLALEHGAVGGDTVLVDLTRVEPGAVADALLAALSLTPRADTPARERLVEALSLRATLLILDNCEQVLDEVADLLAVLLERTHNVVFLATSREPIGTIGERVLLLRPLDVPHEHTAPADQRESSAVRLFLDRAERSGAATLESDADIGRVAELCRRLDGIPLAIEFAAARTRTLSPAEILEQLDAGRALTANRRAGVPAHHVSLDDAIEWSYRLLGDGERALLEALTVFSSWFDVAAAAAIIDADEWDVADLLARLADRSLLQSENLTGAGRRYRQLQTVRAFARRRVDEASQRTLRDRHAAYHAAFIDKVAATIPGPHEDAAFAALRLALDDIRRAFQHARASGDTDRCVRLAVGPRLSVAVEAASLSQLALQAVELPQAPEHERYVALLAAAAWGAVLRGDVERARALAGDAAALVGDVVLEPRLCWIYPQATATPFTEGSEQNERAAVLAAQSGDGVAEAFLLATAAIYKLASGDDEESSKLAERALIAAQREKSRSLQVRAATALAYARRDVDPDGASAAAEMVLRLAAPEDHHVETAHRVLGVVAARRRQWAAAADHVDAASQLLVRQGDAFVQSVALRQFACLVAEHDADLAARLFGAADTLMPGRRFMVRDGRMFDQVEADLNQRLGTEVAAARRAEGRALFGPQIVALTKQGEAVLRERARASS